MPQGDQGFLTGLYSWAESKISRVLRLGRVSLRLARSADLKQFEFGITGNLLLTLSRIQDEKIAPAGIDDCRCWSGCLRQDRSSRPGSCSGPRRCTRPGSCSGPRC